MAKISVTSAACASFVPVQLQEPSPLPATSCTAPPSRPRPGVVEAALGSGRSMKLDEGIDPAVSDRLAGALGGDER